MKFCLLYLQNVLVLLILSLLENYALALPALNLRFSALFRVVHDCTHGTWQLLMHPFVSVVLSAEHLVIHLSVQLSTHSSAVNASFSATGEATEAFLPVAIEQFKPLNPSKQTHRPFAHNPLLEHWFGHSLISHAGPAKPWRHWHLPVASWQTPFLLQSSGHVRISHATPPQACAQDLQALQLHVPVIVSHVPWPEQSFGHFLWPQSVPKNMSWHEQVPLTHRPLPEHILVKSFVGH